MAKSVTSRKTAKPAAEPRLGIFWLVKGKLLIDTCPLSECEKYGDHLNYPGSHIRVWEHWQKADKAPVESEYEEFPRGRVTYRAGSGFTVLADRCILRRKDLIVEIKRALQLPSRDISLGTDPHYRCSRCLYGAGEDD